MQVAVKIIWGRVGAQSITRMTAGGKVILRGEGEGPGEIACRPLGFT